MTKGSAVLYCLEDAAMYLGVSVLEIKRFWQKGEIRCCRKLSVSPEIGAFVLCDSIESYISELYFDSVKNGDSLPNNPRMPISSSDAIQTDDLGYLNYQTVNEWGYETGNTLLVDTYEARVFESFDGTRFSVYEIEQDGENEWSIQPQEPVAFSFSLSNDGLLKEALFSVEELDRVKLHLSAPKESTAATPAPLVKERTSAAKKQWKTPAEFFDNEDNFAWRPEEGREVWWQVALEGPKTELKECLYRALLLYFRYRPEAPDPAIHTLIEFMRAYVPHKNEKSPLWEVKTGRKGLVSFDGSDPKQRITNVERTMEGILKTRIVKN